MCTHLVEVPWQRLSKCAWTTDFQPIEPIALLWNIWSVSRLLLENIHQWVYWFSACSSFTVSSCTYTFKESIVLHKSWKSTVKASMHTVVFVEDFANRLFASCPSFKLWVPITKAAVSKLSYNKVSKRFVQSLYMSGASDYLCLNVAS